MAVNVKMGVDTSAFKSNIQEATAQLKTFDAQLKYAEATMKATGNAEQGLTTKMNALTGKLETQKRMAQQMAQQLERMRQAGVDPLSKEYQKLATSLLNVSTGIVETESQLNDLTVSETKAAAGADKLTQSVNGISKKLSLDQVISGIDYITTGLENAAKKAVDFGKQLWDTIMDTARRSDDVATMASMYDIPLQKYKQMLALEASGLDTTVDAMLTAQDKLNKGVGNSAEATMKALRDLNLLTNVMGKNGNVWETITPDSVELFWEAGQALLKMTDAYDKEAAAQALFGRSWKELKPLFMEYKSLEEYEAALENVAVSSEEATENSAELADRVGELENTWTQLKDEIIGAVAPALSEGVQALNGVLSAVLDYLQKPEGQEALSKLGDAISGLFADLSKIDPKGVVKGFTEVFTAVTGGIQWLVDNAETAKGILAAIVTGWGMLTIGENVLRVIKFIEGIQGLASGAAEAGAAAGTSWGTAFAGAVAKAAPWLIGLYTLLKPSETGDNSLADASGNLSEEGWMDFYQQRQRYLENGEEGFWSKEIAAVGKYVEDAERIWDDMAAVLALTSYLKTDNKAQLIQDLTAMGYTQKISETEKSLAEMENYEVDVNVLLDAAEGASQIQEQVGTVKIPVDLEAVGGSEGGHGFGYEGGGSGGGHGFANGLWSVPFDNFIAYLHKGERVVPAREVGSSRNYSSNLYVESMYMNNGQDAEGLAAAMAAAQRRTMSGYGS